MSHTLKWSRLLAVLLLAPVARAGGQRPLAVDDLFALRRIGDVVGSPNGEWLAVVITRSWTNVETHRNFPLGVDHADVWLVPRRGGKPRNITNGVVDGSGYWNPVWSPDGKYLAMLSTEGGDNVRPFVWGMASGTLRRLSERGADLSASTEEGKPAYGMIWMNPTTLLCPTLPDGAAPSNVAMTSIRTYREAVRSWTKAAQGIDPTVSVLESGRELRANERPVGQLLAIDVVSGQTRAVAEGNFRQLLISPTRQHLALIAETGRIPPQVNRKIPFLSRAQDLWRTQLAILALKEGAKPVWVANVYDPKISSTFKVSLGGDVPHSWSPDGSSFAVLAKDTKDDETATSLLVVAATTGKAQRMTDGRLEVMATAWSSTGVLLALGRPRIAGATAPDTARHDWWAIDQGGSGTARNLTAQLKAVPPVLIRTPERHIMLGIAAGDLWSIDVRDGTVKDVTNSLEPEIQAMVWPSKVQRKVRAHQDVIVQTKGDELYVVHLVGHETRISVFPRPSRRAIMAAFDPERRLVAFTAAESDGTFLWTDDWRPEGFARRIVLNEDIRFVADARRLLVDYQDVDGDSLKGIVLLPVGYEVGKRYPLVTWVYAGITVTDTTYPTDLINKQNPSSLNLNLLPAHGYALLIPSMPLPPEGQASDPYIDLPKGVMAAIDRVISLGIADPKKLGVMGQSYGGYSTYALVTYTHRFKAAVALGGLSDLVSLYGTFFTPLRYAGDAHEALFAPALSESGQIRMGDSPSGNLWRYLRNSPLYFVDRVQTPIMIVQGDIDYIPMQQAEEFFTALYRMGKEATLVRYWGEGHVIESPANVRDMWHRIFEWFDTHLQHDQLERAE